jgi:hypothetical protein
MSRQPGIILLVIAMLLIMVSQASAADSQLAKYESAVHDSTVTASITSPAFINSIPHPISSNKPIRKNHEKPFEPPADKVAKLVVGEYDPNNPHNILDNVGTPDKSEPLFQPCHSFEGVSNTGWNPPDPHMAAGPEQIVAVVNSSIAIFDKATGQKLLQSTADFWFQNTDPAPPSYFIYDPKVVYDPVAGHFIILYLCTDDISRASFLVSVSQTSDAMGDWYSYNLDATLNGTMPTNTWPDYPGLGFDYDQAVYLTSNMWSFGGDYLYPKIRVLDKTALYSGTLTTWNDIWNLRYHDLSVAFTVKPAVSYSDAGGEFLLSNIWYGANYTTYWKIIDPLGTPLLIVKPQVNLSSSYPSPPDAVQKGGDPTIGNLGAMTQEVLYRNGKVYTSFSQSYNWGSGAVGAIRILGIDTVSSTAAVDEIFGADGIHYYFPAIYVDPSDRIFGVFSRSSTSEYIGIHYVEDFLNDPTSKLLRQGDNHRSGASPTRWGDYGGLSADPDDQNKVWLFHEYAGSSETSWRTWIGQIPSKIGKPALATPVDAGQVEEPFELSWDTTEAAVTYSLQVDDDPTFNSPAINITVDGNSYQIDSLPDMTTYYWRVQGISNCDDKSWSDSRSFTVCNFLAGDVSGNGIVNISDVTFLIQYIFGGGLAPDPLEQGDTNCDTVVNISDAIALLSYIFANGPEPCKLCQ